MFDIPKAQVELAAKSLHQIQVETAYTWGSRAVIAWRKYAETGGSEWLAAYTSYRDEAVEHAALAEIYPQFMREFSIALGNQ